MHVGDGRRRTLGAARPRRPRRARRAAPAVRRHDGRAGPAALVRRVVAVRRARGGPGVRRRSSATPAAAPTGPVALTVDAGADAGRAAPAVAADDRQRAPLARDLDRHHRRPRHRRGAQRGAVARRTTSSASRTCGRTGSSATTSAVYREVDGEPVHDFAGVDRVYDHVRSLGLYPVVEISFMPHDLASDPTKTVFEYDAIISPPKDWERWHDLVRDLTAHLVERYGDEVVEHWSFEVWNEANLEVFWSGTPRGLPQAVRRHRGRRPRRRRAAAGRRAVLRRRRLGGGAARPRRPVGRAGRLRLHPHLRRTAARLPADARAVRPDRDADLVDRVGRHAHALQRGQRRGLLRGVPAPRDVLVDGPDRVAVLLGGLRPLRGARPAAGAAARRVRPAHGRRAAQAALVGAGDARAARLHPTGRVAGRRRCGLAGRGGRGHVRRRATCRCCCGT